MPAMKLIWSSDAPPWSGRAQAVVAQELGYFRQFGIDEADIRVIPGERDAVEALLRGEINVLSGMARKAMIAQSQGAPFRIVAMPVRKLHAGLAVDPSITNPLELRGKTVAVGIFGAMVERLARMSLQLLGVDPNEVNYIAGGTGSLRMDLIRQGACQAAIMMNINLVAAQAAGFTIFDTLSRRYPTYAFHALTTTTQVLEEQPDLMPAILAGCLRGQDVLMDDARAEEIAPFFTSQIPGGSKEDWLHELRSDRDALSPTLAFEDEAFRCAVSFEQEFGLLPPDYDYRAALDPAPLQHAARMVADSRV
jgi:ABC-type nitrate/sulfonate/bicarbonate transport system substrate-binding protein